METIQSLKEMTSWSDRLRREGHLISFVPTMGFLHEGHLSLMKEGKRLGDKLVISIFVNPTQFGPGEDFDTYPSDLEKDFKLARDIGVDVIFTPNKADFYPQGFDTFINQEKLPNHLCGLARAGHFQGVMTIVTKLFNVVNPDIAVFGEKDFQQLAIIRRMVKDLNFNIRIIGHPTVRESDGLAMSSRNSKLTPDQRITALSLISSLKKAQNSLKNKENSATALIGNAVEFICSHPDTEIDYIKICDPDTLDDVAEIDRPVVMAMAVKVGTTRLIDNVILNPDQS
ncbi:MAG: pantoate--beta-alanine ligase [Desulfobacteraceae bacterium]|nr:pantoate--beta-alanine ligase [Desulfobacteraceae bacterium]MBC2755265.1 pantoate--beta-alanine ligase [Desulfobacteraceae bacterium]